MNYNKIRQNIIFFVTLFVFNSITIFAQKSGDYFIRNININTIENNYGVAFYEDNIIFYSALNEDKNLDFYYGFIDDYGDIYGSKKMPSKVNSKFNEIDLVFTSDLKRVYFTRGSGRYGSHLELYTATVDGPSNWSNIKRLPFNRQNRSVGHPALSADNKTLYFSSNLKGIGGYDIFKVAVLGKNRYGKMINLGDKVNTKDFETSPFIDNGILYFSSIRDGGLGDYDIYSYNLQNKTAEVKNLGPAMNSDKDDFGFVLKNDINLGYISSKRNNGKGKKDIYSFQNFDNSNSFVIKKKEEKVKLEEIEKPKEPTTPEELTYIEKPEIKKVVLPKKSIPKKEKQNTVTTKKRKVDKRKKRKEALAKAKLRRIKERNKARKLALAKANKPKTITLKPKVISKPVVVESKPVKITDLPKKEMQTNKKTIDPVQKKISNVETKEKNIEIDKKLAIPVFIKKEKTVILKKKHVIGSNDIKKIKNKVGSFNYCKLSIEKLKDIHFNSNSTIIRYDAKIILNKAIKVLKKCSNYNFAAKSFTDSRGSQIKNLRLSQRRADAVVRYIILKGKIPRRQVEGFGFGERSIKNRCYNGVRCSAAEHQVNRRTELKIINIGY